jgi:predicted TPR repeat methyltransferase
LLRAALTPFLNPAQDPWKAADLGCGTGLCAPLFADIVGKLIGVDISPNMIEVAKQGGGYYKLYVMDVLEFLQRYKEEFNLVIAADVFVYLGQLDTLFSACWRALQSPGFFCFSIETLMPEEIAAQPEFPDFQLRKTGRYAHNPAYIQRLAEQTNFKIEVANSETLRHQEEGPMMGNIYVLKK